MSGCGCGGSGSPPRKANNGRPPWFTFGYQLNDGAMNRPMRRRYANPAPGLGMVTAAAAGIGLLIGSLIARFQGREQLGVFYVSGQTVDLPQGASFTVRLPPGTYDNPGLDERLMRLGTVQSPQFTDVAFLIGGDADTYATAITFVNVANPQGTPKLVSVIGRKIGA